MRRGVIRGMVGMAMLAGAAGAWAAPAGSFSRAVERAIDEADRGMVRLAYPARDGVDGHGTRVFHQGRDVTPVIRCDTEEKLVLVEVELTHGRIRDIDVWLGADWRFPCSGRDGDCRDLGRVDAAEAAAWFLDLALDSDDDDVAEDALQAAVMARGTDIVEPLLDIARGRRHPEELREDAVMWLALFAADKAVDPIARLTRAEQESADFRENAVMALAMMDDVDTLPMLMDMARHHRFPEVQEAALMMLGQRGDSPEVLALLEEILLED